ncbi:hypothetical protein KSP40_PGU018020 [Platanthera guangdongensis]|uniref:Maturase K n=1 Tax=Platanthera guangdongensis TaxID=2320717 RepID=A0ABR2LGN0_9ASPA
MDYLTALPNMFFGRADEVAAAPKSRKIEILESRKIIAIPEIALLPRLFSSLIFRESSALDRGKSPSPPLNPVDASTVELLHYSGNRQSSSPSRLLPHAQYFIAGVFHRQAVFYLHRWAAELQIVSMEKQKIFLDLSFPFSFNFQFNGETKEFVFGIRHSLLPPSPVRNQRRSSPEPRRSSHPDLPALRRANLQIFPRAEQIFPRSDVPASRRSSPFAQIFRADLPSSR